MKRVHEYAASEGCANCRLADGRDVLLPIFPGILKHPKTSELEVLLQDERVARKYTKLALQRAAWPILSRFPAAWLRECLESADVRSGRKQALQFLLGEQADRSGVSRSARPSGFRPQASV